MNRRNISPERKGIYYLGMALIILGAISFGSVFLFGILRFGDFHDFQGHVRGQGLRAFFGIALVFAGGILMRVGTRGLAGSGFIIDPEKARQDVEPWSRMAGGAVKDALDEAGIDLDEIRNDNAMPFDEKLRRLQRLEQEGVITKQEFEREKREILDSN